jgi:hypothetical protein
MQSAATVTRNIREHGFDQLKADAAFRLQSIRACARKTRAEHYWDLARSLNPDSINFIRQNLTLTEEGLAGNL